MGVIAEVGAAVTAWLRLTAGALIFLALARPPLREVRRQDVPALLGLGVASGLMGVTFLAAIERIPLGTAVAIEFLGPLTVAAVRSHTSRHWRHALPIPRHSHPHAMDHRGMRTSVQPEGICGEPGAR